MQKYLFEGIKGAIVFVDMCLRHVFVSLFSVFLAGRFAILVFAGKNCCIVIALPLFLAENTFVAVGYLAKRATKLTVGAVTWAMAEFHRLGEKAFYETFRVGKGKAKTHLIEDEQRYPAPSIWLAAAEHMGLADPIPLTAKIREELQGLGFEVATDQPWSLTEVTLTVDAYFSLMEKEEKKQPFNKSDQHRLLSKKLNHRSEGAIGMKFQNITHVLIELGQAYLSGYMPLGGVQALLRQVVEDRVKTSVYPTVAPTKGRPIAEPDSSYGNHVPPPPPPSQETVAQVAQTLKVVEAKKKPKPKRVSQQPTTKTRRRDYLAEAEANTALGELGERVVLTYEKLRLQALGLNVLSEKVEWVAQTKGDGLGYDILSFDEAGGELFIEVKTTRGTVHGDFEMSSAEYRMWRAHPDQYRVYRLSLRKPGTLVILDDPERVTLTPTSYRVTFFS